MNPCLPPPGLRDIPGWHWLSLDDAKPEPVHWELGGPRPIWRWINRYPKAPDEAAAARWVYRGPVTYPGDA